MYRYLEAGLVRAVAIAGGTDVPPRPAEIGDGRDSERWLGWIIDVCRDEALIEAIAVASPQLHGRLSEITDGNELRARQVRRAALALHRYLLRKEHRATPFGLFAGISALNVTGEQTVLLWQDQHQPTARVDAAWLHQIVAGLETSSELLHRLRVVAEPSLFVRDGRLVLPYCPGSAPNGAAPGEVSVRHSRPVQTVITLASAPLLFHEAVAQVARVCQGVAIETVEKLVANLVAAGFLHTELRPVVTDTNPLRTLVRRLSRARAQDTDEAAFLQ